jgi:hypothetical protein
LAGLIFIAFGVGTIVLARDYEIGSALEMGPGYFPAAMGLLLAVLGIAAIVRGVTRKVRDPITRHRVAPLLLVFAGILAFSFLIESAGLIVAAAALIGIACLQNLRSKPLEVIVIYLVLTGFSALVFVHWFDMRMPLLWWR